jgi:hypothetical protein
VLKWPQAVQQSDVPLAAAQVLMTFNEMCGYFFALGLANVLLRQLTLESAWTGINPELTETRL